MRSRLVAGATLGIAAQLSSIGLLLTSAWLIVRAAQHPPVMYLMVAIVAVRFFGVGRAVFHYGERLFTHDAALAATTEQRVNTYRELDRVAPFGLERQRRGDVISRIVGDVESGQDRLLRLDLPWLYALVSAASVVILLAFIRPAAGLVLAVHVLACCAFIRLAVARTGRDLRSQSAGHRGTLSADASSFVLSSRDLVAYGVGRESSGDEHQTIDDLASSQLSAAWVGGLGTAFVLVSTGAAVTLMALLATDVPAALVGVLLLAPIALIEPLDALADAERLRPEIVEAERRLRELEAVPTPVAVPLFGQMLPATNVLAVRDLVVGWDRAITAPISFEVGVGDILGITGPSGVGKTTLALTLLKLVESRGGSIQLGGVNFCDILGSDIRTRVGMSGQDHVVFDTTIRENLRIADPQANDRAIWTALERAGLASFVRSLPAGLDTPAGEAGSELSGGERQRLGVAQLLLARHDILIFDEPTEHLDVQAAAALLSDIAALTPDHGVVIISHSAMALDRCDRLVRLTRTDPYPVSTLIGLETTHV
ncbi:MAG: thiol reductant ABC exporter subunit CydC [Aeromicrobium sp.]